jgi:alpha-tubulin suppressor-like RCC1 family protein
VFWWRDIKAVAAGPFFTVGLKRDGTVTACGRNEYGQCGVGGWRDVVQVSAGVRHTVGLRADGSVVAVGQNKNGECDVGNWRNIVSVSAGYLCTFGIKRDGRVLVRGDVRNDNLDVSHLTDVADIVNPAPFRAIALKRDGTIVRVGRDNIMRRSFAKWTGITAISAGPDYFAGLLADGTVRLLAYFWEASGIECGADGWTDIAAIAAGRFHLLGVRKDGEITAVMMHPNPALDKGQCEAAGRRVM